MFGLNLSEAEEVVSIIYKKAIDNDKETIPDCIKNSATIEVRFNDKSIRHWSWRGAAVSTIGGAEDARHRQYEVISDKHFQKYKSNKTYLQNCVSALSQILSTIANSYWKYKNFISVIFCNC